MWPLTGVLHPGMAAEWGPLSLGDWVWPLAGLVLPLSGGPLSLGDWVWPLTG